jgi:orotate phosphoribosyltransferase-like protein
MTNLFKSREQIANELGVDVKTVKHLFEENDITLSPNKRVSPRDWQELYRRVAPELLKTT